MALSYWGNGGPLFISSLATGAIVYWGNGGPIVVITQLSAQTISPAAIASTGGIGAPALNLAASPTSIASGETEGQPQVKLAVAPPSISSLEQCGAPTLNLVIYPAGVGTQEEFGAQAVIPGTVTLYPESIQTQVGLGAPALNLRLHPYFPVEDNFIPNPDFEPDITGWSKITDGEGALSLSTTAPYNGLHHARLVNADAFSKAGIRSDIFNPDWGCRYRLAVAVKTSASRQVAITIYDPTFEEYQETQEPTQYVQAGTEWTLFEYIFWISESQPADGRWQNCWIEVEVEGGDAVTLDVDFTSLTKIQVGEPTVTSVAHILLDGIAPEEAHGSPVLAVTFQSQPIVLGGIGTQEGLGQPALGLRVYPAGITSGESFGRSRCILRLNPMGVASDEACGEPQLVLRVAPSGVASQEAFGQPHATPGPVTLSPTSIVSGELWGIPRANLTLCPAGLASVEAFGSQAVIPGGVTVHTVGLATQEALGLPSLSALIHPASLGSAEACGTPALSMLIQPTAVGTGEGAGVPKLNLLIRPAGISSLEAFEVPIVALYGKVYSKGIVTGEQLGVPTTDLIIHPAAVASQEAVGDPMLAFWGAAALPDGVSSQENFGRCVVTHPHLRLDIIALWSSRNTPAVEGYIGEDVIELKRVPLMVDEFLKAA